MTRKERLNRMNAMLRQINAEDRLFTDKEKAEWEGHAAAIELLDLERAEPAKPVGKLTPVGSAAPAVHTSGKRRFSLARAARAFLGDASVDAGFEREQQQELARTRQRPAEGFLVPLSIFQRAADTTTVSPDSGHSLVGTDYRGDLLERINNAIFLPPMASALGVTQISSPESTVVIPRMTSRLTPSWIARDATPSAASDATFDSISMTPTTLALYFQINRSFIYATNPMGEDLLLNDARIGIESELDNVIVNGTGASNQPLGFLGTSGATASANYGGSTHVTSANAFTAGYLLLDEVESYLKAETPSLRWLLHPRFVANLKQTPAFTGALTPLVGPNDTQWSGRAFVQGGYALPAPSGSPASTKGLVGDFSEMVACTFGDSIDFVLNPFADSVFPAGGMLVRGLLDYQQAHRDIKKVLVFNSDTV